MKTTPDFLLNFAIFQRPSEHFVTSTHSMLSGEKQGLIVAPAYRAGCLALQCFQSGQLAREIEFRLESVVGRSPMCEDVWMAVALLHERGFLWT